MNGKKARNLRNMSKYISKDKTTEGVKKVYKKLKWIKKKHKYTDL